MPTYRNDGTIALQVTGMSGENVLVQPGHIVYTEDLLTETYMTKTADTPYYNPTLYSDTIRLGTNASGETSVVNSDLVKSISIQNSSKSSGEADVYFNARANNMAARVFPGFSSEFLEESVAYKVNKVVIASTPGAVVSVVIKKA